MRKTVGNEGIWRARNKSTQSVYSYIPSSIHNVFYECGVFHFTKITSLNRFVIAATEYTQPTFR